MLPIRIACAAFRWIRIPPPSLLKPRLDRLLLAVCLLAAAPLAAMAAVPVPTVSLPPTGNGIPFETSSVDLATWGYTESEYLLSGTAQAYVNSGDLGTDGVWTAAPGATTPYVTRMLVRMPTHPQQFNGTVVVEWLNVSGGIDATPEWDYAHVELLRKGYIWVGVSAQYNGAAFLPLYDSVRYASIFHPGDSWSYDIYSQAAMALLKGTPQPLGKLTPLVHTMLAAGESQSAFRVMTYYNAIQPLANIYQGFLIHSTGSGAPLSQSYAGGGAAGAPPVAAPPGVPATPDITVPATAFVRGDLPQPVMFFNTETDITFLGAGFSVHNEADSNTFRMWEIAGTTHADTYLLNRAALDAEKSGLQVPPFNCGDPPLNDGPETFAVRKAVRALNDWTRTPKHLPAIGPRLSVQIVEGDTPTALINRDPTTGIALGGIRLPQVAAPIETLTGIRPSAAVNANPNCALFGAADPWDGDTDAWDGQDGLDPSPTPEPSLAALYGTQDGYLFVYRRATTQAVLDGFLLQDDVPAVIDEARSANVLGAAKAAIRIPFK